MINGGDTGPMLADYPGNWSCGTNKDVPDALYKLYSSTGGSVHIKATPKTGYDAVLGLFDGTNGAPLRLADVSSLVEDTACVPTSGPSNLTNITLKHQLSRLNKTSSRTAATRCSSRMIRTARAGWTCARRTGAAAARRLVQATQPAGPDLVVIVTKSMQVAAGASLRILGSRPVLFVVSGGHAQRHSTVSPDAVGNPTSWRGWRLWLRCHEPLNAQAVLGSGGGGGGGFGAALVATTAMDVEQRARWTRGHCARRTLTPLLGGCSGGDAAFGSSGSIAAGAVQISATTSIVLGASGGVGADGSNGVVGASDQAGGSGAASGGAILLQSPTITWRKAAGRAAGGNGGGSRAVRRPLAAAARPASPGNAGQDAAALQLVAAAVAATSGRVLVATGSVARTVHDGDQRKRQQRLAGCARYLRARVHPGASNTNWHGGELGWPLAARWRRRMRYPHSR